MAASDPSARRRLPVRLVDVPVELRLKAARELCRLAKTDRERAELIGAALAPSAATFYVTDDEPLRAAA
jgi:hypothetical protein